MTRYEHARIRILKFLWDVELGRETAERHPSLGVIGAELFERLAGDLTPDEFKAQLDYLEDKDMVVRKPSEMPRTRSREQELEIAHYKITSYGTDVVEGNQADAGLPQIQQVINIGDISADSSQLLIGSPGARVDVNIMHPKAELVSKTLADVEASLSQISAPEVADSARRLIQAIKLELTNPPEEQDTGVLESALKRLNKKLEPYKGPLSVLASLAAMLGIVL